MSESKPPETAVATSEPPKEVLEWLRKNPDQARSLVLPDVDVPTVKTMRVVGDQDVERYEVNARLPASMQYAVRSTLRPTSDGFDLLNRVLGVQFVEPKFVVDEKGAEVRNPIHRRDYLLLSLIGIWYNDIGQLTSYGETIELDFQMLYRAHIVGADSYKLRAVRGAGRPDPQHTDEFLPGPLVLDDDGNPQTTFDVNDRDLEKAQKELFRMRQFGPRIAKTSAKSRILMTALGLKSLPVKPGWVHTGDRNCPAHCERCYKGTPIPYTMTIRLVGYRDRLTPEQREERAEKLAEQLYTKPGRPTIAQEEIVEEVRQEQDRESEESEATIFDPDKVTDEPVEAPEEGAKVPSSW